MAQISRFLVVGATATAIHYGLLIMLHGGLHWDGVLASSVGFLISAVFNFCASYTFTYRSRAPVLRSALRYCVVAGTGLCLNAAMFWFLVSQLGWQYLLGQIIATGVVMIWNYVLGRIFTFAGGPTAPDGPTPLSEALK